MRFIELLYLFGSMLGCFSFAYLTIKDFPESKMVGLFWFFFPIFILIIHLHGYSFYIKLKKVLNK